MRNFYICIFFFVSCTSVIAQDQVDIFPGLHGDTLVSLLQNNYTPGDVQSYRDGRIYMYTELYNTNDTVETIYSGLKRYLNPNAEEPIQYLLSGNIDQQVNTEHAYPRSKGADSNTNAGSDLHHLFPSSVRVNSDRSNLPFGEVNDQNTNKWYLDDDIYTAIPTSNIDAYSELGEGLFEPREHVKGNISRAVFYFYTIYRNRAENADPAFFPAMLDDLCTWHNLDPVDSLEIARTKLIGTFQEHEGNPFVLDCSLVSRLYCNNIMEACYTITETEDHLHTDTYIIYPNPAREYLVIRKKNNDIFTGPCQIIDLEGKVIIHATGQSIISLSTVPSGSYFICISLEDGTTTTLPFMKI